MSDSGTHVSGVGGHDSEVVVVDDLLHLLHTSEVSQHVSDGHDVSIVNEALGDLLGGLDCSGSHGLRDI